MTAPILMLIGFVLSAAGILMVLGAGKNEFDRRDHYGVESFKSYGELVEKRVLDWMLRFLGFMMFLGGGVMMFLAAIKV